MRETAAACTDNTAMYELAWPSVELLPHFQAALERGWSRNNVMAERTRHQDLEKIHADPQAFVASLVNLEGGGDEVQLPDGSYVPRLPGYSRWVFLARQDLTQEGSAQGVDLEFAGTINIRYVLGTSQLPYYCLGHIGYATVPWQQGRGAASFALAQLIKEATAAGHLRGMDYLEITTQPDNAASQAVITKCGGKLIERYTEPPMYGGQAGLKFRIPLASN
jgi:RimJ/RimL family protein N-acetyltransferase